MYDLEPAARPQEELRRRPCSVAPAPDRGASTNRENIDNHQCLVQNLRGPEEDTGMPNVAATVEPAIPADRAAIESLLTALGLPVAGLAEHLDGALVAREGGDA